MCDVSVRVPPCIVCVCVCVSCVCVCCCRRNSSITCFVEILKEGVSPANAVGKAGGGGTPTATLRSTRVSLELLFQVPSWLRENGPHDSYKTCFQQVLSATRSKKLRGKARLSPTSMDVSLLVLQSLIATGFSRTAQQAQDSGHGARPWAGEGAKTQTSKIVHK